MAVPESLAAAPAQKKWWTQVSERADCEDPSIPDSAKITYEGFCHCQAVAYTVRLPALDGLTPHNVSVCTCSICSKAGLLMVYPARKNFCILRGEELLKSYHFASKRVRHRFCGKCGSNVFADVPIMKGTEQERIPCNVRMFRGIDLEKLNYIYFDGKHRANQEANEYTW